MKKGALKRFCQVVCQFLLVLLILFAAAGTTTWRWAWIYIGIAAAVMLINVKVIHPELADESSEKRDDAKRWDVHLSSMGIVTVVGMFVVAGLDYRFLWSPDYAAFIHWGGAGVVFSGNIIFTWAMSSNKHFTTLVNVRTENGHTVIEKGPYKYVRHPGYAGYILTLLSTPVLLGSLWAMIPSGITVVIFILRTYYEDRVLQRELPGYINYMKWVKYRLLPGVW